MTRSSSTPLKIDRLDPLIHERSRLAIVSLLAAAPAGLGFVEVKNSLAMTDGNLSVHLRVLEEAGFVESEKSFVDRKPRTSLRLSRKGRTAFRHYVEELGKIVKGAKRVR